MKRIVFGGFCMLSGILLFGQTMPLNRDIWDVFSNLGTFTGFLSVCAEIAGAVLAVYGFYLGFQEIHSQSEQ